MAANSTIGSIQSSTNSNGKIRTVRQMIRAGVELLAHDLEAGHPEVLTECLKAIARFFWLSFGNILLIYTQRPSAQQVAGFKAWNELGRRVRQGEKGIMIFAPILSEPKRTATGDAQIEPQLLGFRPVRVWDIDQTDGEPIAAHDTVNSDLADVLKKLMELAASEEI